MNTPEHTRLKDADEGRADWKLWGPYLSDRAWGTVREDYSAGGAAWEAFSHDQARSRAFRWNEDGLGGFCNRMQSICLSVGLWNEKDPILKERLFGLTGNEGNHGEDVKEYYFYLDSTPTHSYARMVYKYPHVAYPYNSLVEENRRRSKFDPEFELIDALRQAFEENRYFDIVIEYAKVDTDDLLCRITAINRGPVAAPLHLLPTIWFRNTWSWEEGAEKPVLQAHASGGVQVKDLELGEYWWYVDASGSAPSVLFTENETNHEKLFGSPNASPFTKDSFHDAIIRGEQDRLNPANRGTKAAGHVQTVIDAGEAHTVMVRLSASQQNNPFSGFEATFTKRIKEADTFYETVHDANLTPEERNVQRQALAGLLWSKQFYHYDVEQWLTGDPAGPVPPGSRWKGRNHEWTHLNNMDIISMPDKWEYPWYAAWDLAFHMIPVAMIDPEWAKHQLILMTREWYMHPNGQLPAYEWAFGDVNPPVHAWAAWRVYKISKQQTGKADTDFLERVFHKMLLNFTWWVNRKDADGNNVFQGGFLGLDNIGVFDRSAPLPDGGYLDQADGTAWMGMFCLNMLAISLELAKTKPVYEDVATKFFEHFVYIANAINKVCSGKGLWNEEDGFYYDALNTRQGEVIPLKIRSFVGLIPLFAVESIEPELLEQLPDFKQRMDWFITYKPKLMENLTIRTSHRENGTCLLSLVNEDKLQRIMEHMLNESKFLSDYGLRALSQEHRDTPYEFYAGGQVHKVAYEPAESTSGLFGGNSNWRGPIWFPVNYLLIESLQKFHYFYEDEFKVAFPSGSGQLKNLDDVADELASRLCQLFLAGSDGKKPYYGGIRYFQEDPNWRDYILFYEYFHGDNGAGVGASHQTGWTSLVANLLQQISKKR